MSAHQMIVSRALAAFAVIASPLFGAVAAQPSGAPSQRIWENDRMQVRRVSLEPGERLTGESTGGSVLVFLTTDLDGRIPAVEAAWRDPGPAVMENRGRARFEALVIDLKDGATRSRDATPPEVVRATDLVAPRGASTGVYGTGIRTENLIVNDRVSVTKERYPTGLYWSVDPLHVHPHDAVVIYLRGGYIWPATWFYGPERVHRGDVRVVPGNVLHRTGNAGSDPVEFLLVIPT